MTRLKRFVPNTLAKVRFEARGEGGKRWIIGHASVFDQWTELYRGRTFVVREIVRPGAFTRALAEGQDVRSLFNHDANIILGRTTNGTLLLSEDATGLFSETDYLDTATVRDLVIAPMDRGDITGMSFGFLPASGGYRLTEYEQDGLYHYDFELRDADLYDVSPVTYPAYKGTDVGLRTAADPAATLRNLGFPDPGDVERLTRLAESPAPEPTPEPAASAPALDDVSRAARARFLALAGI